MLRHHDGGILGSALVHLGRRDRSRNGQIPWRDQENYNDAHVSVIPLARAKVLEAVLTQPIPTEKPMQDRGTPRKTD